MESLREKESFFAAPTTEMTPGRATSTTVPKKRKASALKDDINSDTESVISKKAKATPDPAKPRRRKSSETPKNTRAIGRSYEECSDYDKKLIDMYKANKSWAEIRNVWEEMTGDKTATSTLPNRYTRLMNNFTVLPDNDKAILIAAKQEVERAFESSKWSKIADEMKKRGTTLYKGAVLERQYKKMILDAEDLPPVAAAPNMGGKPPAEVNDDSDE